MHEQPVVSRLRRRPSRSARTFESNEPKIAPICTQETVIDHSVISCFLDNVKVGYKAFSNQSINQSEAFSAESLIAQEAEFSN
ncbi:hypothetical protein T4E_3301 [Trichinella pseudospiralis]|uniref:Uncharacterized protein n=1 Tax=Trichinella pseudospiralis TaxID=6337 RepID=A0A0V0XZN5_TRIPS|nr:hypothetical protein T4E_3301 [Trichinella pseudospiralis]